MTKTPNAMPLFAFSPGSLAVACSWAICCSVNGTASSANTLARCASTAKRGVSKSNEAFASQCSRSGWPRRASKLTYFDEGPKL